MSCATPSESSAEKSGALPHANKVVGSTREKSGVSAAFGHTAWSTSSVECSPYQSSTNDAQAPAPAVVRAFMNKSSDSMSKMSKGSAKRRGAKVYQVVEMR